MKQATGSYSLALMPLGLLTLVSVVTLLLLSRPSGPDRVRT